MGANYSKTSLITTKLHCNCLAHAMLMDNIIELHLKINACRFFIPLIIEQGNLVKYMSSG